MGGETIVVRRGEHGWQVGTEETADLTSAMVLADLLAADLGTPVPPSAGPPRHSAANHGAVSEEDEAARLAVTVSQLEHALAARVRVERTWSAARRTRCCRCPPSSRGSSRRPASAARRRGTPGPRQHLVSTGQQPFSVT